MMVPLNTDARVTILQNHEGVMLFFARGPTRPATDAAGAAPNPMRFSKLWRAHARLDLESCQRRS